jgi:methylmalonyl-CoA carboxyltransferase large subunit
MKTDNPVDLARLADTLEALRQEVARLSERVAALEKANGQASVPAAPAPARAAAPAAPAPAAEGLSEEQVLVISAAVAAFLGKKAHIRQIRLLGSAAWAQLGRTTIQASHALGHA